MQPAGGRKIRGDMAVSQNCPSEKAKKTGRSWFSSGLFFSSARLHCSVSVLSLHHQIGWSKPGTLQEQIEIRPFEHQLCHMVHLSIFQQTERSHRRKRVFTGEGFSIIIKIYYIGFPEA
jgi:hypothetical protein